MARRRPPRPPRHGPPRHPARVVVLAFAGAIVIGTLLLLLPVARSGPGGAPPLVALFTAASAVCVTGLIVVDTPTYWSPLGQVVILTLIQVGGFGIMTMASLLGLVVSRRLGLRTRLSAATETKSLGLGDLRQVVVGVAKASVVIEGITAALLAARFALGYHEPAPRAGWLGLFHAVSAFNNAGFALFSDNLSGFVSDAWICLPIAASVILGGLGFPVLFELRRELLTPRTWSAHTRLVLATSVVLLVGGTGFVLLTEWGNPATLAPLSPAGRLLAAFFHATVTRTAGFNTLDIAQLRPTTWLGSDVLMFIGGGSAGTAGGIKVTTFTVLLFVIIAEARGDERVNAFGRQLPAGAQRQALAVALLSVAAVIGSTMVLLLGTSFGLDRTLFEAVSAFATVGLSTGITPHLPAGEQLLLVGLMFAGRLGPITVASALALRNRALFYDLPKERPIIG